jgi:hypothetical protein
MITGEEYLRFYAFQKSDSEKAREVTVKNHEKQPD